MLHIQLVLETFISTIFMAVREAYVRKKEVFSSNSRAFDASCRCEFEKVNIAPLESSQVSHAYVRSILWSDRLIIFVLYVSLAHQATD